MGKYIDGVGEVAVPQTFKEKISNFWFHYKWHSVVAVFVIIAVLVCSLQFCTKTSYDIQILYAGGKTIGKTVDENGIAEIETIISALKTVSDDFDQNGEKTVTVANYYYLSQAEITALEEQAKDDGLESSGINYTLLTQDKQALSGMITSSEYYLCFISPAVYEAYKGTDGAMFLPLDSFKEINPSALFYQDTNNAILLSSLEFYSVSGISLLPPDTLICIKTPNYMASNDARHQELVQNAEKVLTNILTLKIN